MSKKTPPLILVDGSSYLYRAFHALPPLINSKGHATGAIKGVINMIRRLHKDYLNSPIAVVFDAKGKTFRHDMYKEYKANRPPRPDELREQIEPIHNIIKAMGIPLLSISGVEADDVIGSLANQATEQAIDVVISTGDKDMAQLVSDHVSLINTMNNATMDREGVIEKFGVRPEQIIDYLALMGDKSDNIPGVNMCGPKTAVKWLSEFGTLKGVLENADKIKGKVGENLRASLEQVPLSYQLATIKLDVELEVGPADLIPSDANNDALLSLYKEFEFKSWIEEILSGKGAGKEGSGKASGKASNEPQDESPPQSKHDTKYDIILDEKLFEQWLKRLKESDLFAFDTETTSLNYMEAKIVGVSFAIKPFEAAYVPLAHDSLDAPDQLNKEWVLEKLKPLLEDDKQKKVGQNLKYDKNVLANEGINLRGIAFDTMLESYVLNSTATRHNMDDLALKFFDERTINFEDLACKCAKHLTFHQI